MSSRKKQKTNAISPDELETPSVSDRPKRSILLLLISVAGLIISLMSGFQEHIPFIRDLCTSACKDTVEIHFLHMPFWLSGALFYSVAVLLALFKRDMVTWIAGPAVGVEAVLILILIHLKAPCPFCIANAAVVLLLVAVAFRKKLFWQQATLALLFFVGFFFWVPFENNLSLSARETAAGAKSGGEADIAATIGGDIITNERLDVLLGPKLMESRKNIYQMKMEKLDQLIVEMILDKEAKEQGKTPENLVEVIVPPGSPTVEESEVDKYVQENQERLKAYQGAIPDLRQRIKVFLAQQKRSQVIRDYARGLDAKYGVRIFVSEPNPPKVTVDTQGCPVLGPSNAPVTIVEFSDYQCPACRSTHNVVKEVRAAYGDKLKWVYKEYPLKRHKDAFKAAEASHCAEDQGKFWEYQEALFNAPDLSPDNLVNIAAQLGMARDKFAACLQDSRYKTLVEKNTQDAVQAGVDRTPTFMVNGTLFVGGPSFEVFKGLIDEELKKAGLQQQTIGKAK